MFSWQSRFLNKNDEPVVSNAIATFEQTTGAELVIAVAKSSDPYPAATLRFAIISGLIISMLMTFFIEISYDFLWIAVYFFTLIIMVPIGKLSFFKRQTLTDTETNREVNEKAIEKFFELCTTKTDHKVSTFMYISLLEKKLVLLVDEGLKEQFDQEQLDSITEKLTHHFQQNKFKDGLLELIESIQNEVLIAFPEKCAQISSDQIHNQVFWIDCN